MSSKNFKTPIEWCVGFKKKIFVTNIVLILTIVLGVGVLNIRNAKAFEQSGDYNFSVNYTANWQTLWVFTSTGEGSGVAICHDSTVSEATLNLKTACGELSIGTYYVVERAYQYQDQYCSDYQYDACKNTGQRVYEGSFEITSEEPPPDPPPYSSSTLEIMQTSGDAYLLGIVKLIGQFCIVVFMANLVKKLII